MGNKKQNRPKQSIIVFLQCSNNIKIMNTLPQETHTRNQRNKKQSYRHPLDSQQDTNTRFTPPQQRDTNRAQSDDNQYYQSRQSYPEASYDNEGLLPPLRILNKQNIKLQPMAMRMRGQEDKTQIYLKNCEYIIKNLRELKHKKEKDHCLTMSTEPTPQNEHQRELSSKQDVQYYPKNQQFSSQGKPYNKLFPVQAVPKYKQNLKKLDDDFYNKNYEYESSSIRVKSLPRKVIKNATLNNYEMEPRGDRNYHRSERELEADQSDIPSGFDQRRQYRSYRRYSSSKSSQRNTPKINTNMEGRQPQREDKQQKQKQPKQDQNVKVQKELISCLSQLTQFLRNQNINTNKQVNQQPEKQNQNESQFNNPTHTHHSIPEQPYSENTIKNNRAGQGDNNQKAGTLKEKAIVVLKKLNQKSKGFVEVTSNRMQVNRTKEQQQQGTKKRPSVTFVDNEQHIGPQQKQTKANPQKADQQKIAKPIISIPTDLKSPHYQNPTTSRQPTTNSNMTKAIQSEQQTAKIETKQSKSDILNSELAKHLVSFLQKQQNQNIELSFCLKELTQFLKIQNDQMEQLKVSRFQQQKQINKTHSPRRHSLQPQEIAEEEEDQQDIVGGKTNTLHEAVLKKLKKARLRGNIFKQKIQNFRKSHNLIMMKRQPRQKQVQKDAEVEPATNISNGAVSQAVQNGRQDMTLPVKQIQAAKTL